jgi:hypothetical protein
MELAPSTDEGKLFVENLFREWSRQVENNWMPLLFVGGIQNKEKYLSFSHSDPHMNWEHQFHYINFSYCNFFNI